MKNYLLAIILLSALSGGLLCLMKNSKYEKHLSYLCSLVLLLSVVSPLKSFFGTELPKIIDISPEEAQPSSLSVYGKLLAEKTEENLKMELSETIASETDLTASDFVLQVFISLSGNDLLLDHIECTLKSPLSVLEREKIEKILHGSCKKIIFIERL